MNNARAQYFHNIYIYIYIYNSWVDNFLLVFIGSAININFFFLNLYFEQVNSCFVLIDHQADSDLYKMPG